MKKSFLAATSTSLALCALTPAAHATDWSVFTLEELRTLMGRNSCQVMLDSTVYNNNTSWAWNYHHKWAEFSAVYFGKKAYHDPNQRQADQKIERLSNLISGDNELLISYCMGHTQEPVWKVLDAIYDRS
ncbi:hypothetical protein [Rhodobacter sp. CZR27]|uniref:hypothetical protein n=1 Tax=Rhodobacter sp. CZR27 TaxID=2033869 RepID=UPI0012FD7295|nr:hypothetical protein [Rhodobacter sp. CZR27]